MEEKYKDILNDKDRTAEIAAQKQIVFLIYIYFVFISLVAVTQITLLYPFNVLTNLFLIFCLVKSALYISKQIEYRIANK